MDKRTRYSINLDVKFGPLELFDVAALAASVADPWFNQTLCRVNDCVVRLGVFKGGEFHWHKHDTEDEVFFVLSGRFVIELEGRRVELGPQQGFTVPRGVLHKTSVPEPTTILMVEAATVKPTGD
jgi:mannose-6-phosphate isomerase-like protein (cupin superfamily)